MLILAEAQELFFTRISGQPKSLRTGAKPLAEDVLTSGVVITGLQMLAKVFAGVGEVFLRLMREHEAEENAYPRPCRENIILVLSVFKQLIRKRDRRVIPTHIGNLGDGIATVRPATKVFSPPRSKRTFQRRSKPFMRRDTMSISRTP